VTERGLRDSAQGSTRCSVHDRVGLRDDGAGQSNNCLDDMRDGRWNYGVVTDESDLGEMAVFLWLWRKRKVVCRFKMTTL
jgi:hypothetical protein